MEVHSLNRNLLKLKFEGEGREFYRHLQPPNRYPRFHLKVYDYNANTRIVEAHIDVRSHETTRSPKFLRLLELLMKKLNE